MYFQDQVAKGVEAMGDILQYVPGRKMTVSSSSAKAKVYIRETRNKEGEPKSFKVIRRFIREQNGILKGIVKACRTTPKPLEEQEIQEAQEMPEEMQEQEEMHEVQEEMHEVQEEEDEWSCESIYSED